MTECRIIMRDKMRPPTYHRQRLLLFLLEQAEGFAAIRLPLKHGRNEDAMPVAVPLKRYE